jgi:hypothetical protein
MSLAPLSERASLKFGNLHRTFGVPLYSRCLAQDGIAYIYLIRRQTRDHINGNKGLTGFITRRRRTSPNIHGNRATFEAPERSLSKDARGGIGSSSVRHRTSECGQLRL